jgi:hypothetical protein
MRRWRPSPPKQHHDGLCDFFGFTETAHRNPADEVVLAFHHIRFDQRGCDGIDGDAFLHESGGVAARQSFNASL